MMLNSCMREFKLMLCSHASVNLNCFCRFALADTPRFWVYDDFIIYAWEFVIFYLLLAQIS
jgi:hypothetical protein